MAWVLMVILAAGPIVPLKIYPRSQEGKESCYADAVFMQENIRMGQLKCGLYKLEEVNEYGQSSGGK